MHELGYCEGVLEAVLARAAGRRVTSVGVRIGVLHGVVAEAFQQSFDVAAAGTVAASARTVLTVLPVRGRCRACRRDFAALDATPACPGCGSWEVALDGGDDVVLEWVGYADASGDVSPVPVHHHEEGD